MLGYYAINIPPIFGGAFIAKCQGPNNEALEYGCRIWLSRVKPGITTRGRCIEDEDAVASH
jgi:hypothetical protein